MTLSNGNSNGITAIVDPDGETVGALKQFEPGVLRGTVVPLRGTTPYVLLGDWPVIIACLTVLATLVVRARQRA